jgi:predicted aldo/keto reductase-like oxidoreductase
MQIFSGGSTNPEKSVEYVCSLSQINSILFGASTAAHIHHTVELIRNLDYKHSLEKFSEPLEYLS